MSTLIERRRNRMAVMKMNSMQRRTGSNFQIVELKDSSHLPLELSEEILTMALEKHFEEMIYDNHKRAEAEILISNHYSNCTGINKLTPLGVDFMNELIKTLAEESVKSQGFQE
ncbi:hypothetical protein [Trabulsiella odontotermitis]|uniref:Uncharacterized protein n=1 Tax=Trabulsiella odontotermitis TaxID=379893 RepID=A0A0L0GZV5_9ENTR|nr:hypothetical protein [Trabulsiella odontotermitis]KNC94003.1 hypothetical protein GM31_16655 [Trabulsiella odontotermitis]